MEKQRNNVVIQRHFGQKYVVPKSHPVLSFTKEHKLQYLINAVNEESGTDIRISTRKREIVYLRAVYFKLAIELTKYSYESIAEQVNRDHATVTHAMTNVWEEVETYRPDIYDIYEKLVMNMDDSEFAELKVLRLKREMDKVKETLSNIRREIEKDYFSLQQKLVNIKKVAYNEIVE